MVAKFLSILFTCCLVAFATTPINADLIKGDLAIIGFDGGNPDEVSFVALTDIANGEQFYFGDMEVNGGTVSDTEELWRFNSTGITAGTVITLTGEPLTTWGVSSGGTVTSITTGPYSDTTSGSNIGPGDDFFFFDSTDGAATTANSTNLFQLDDELGVDIPTGLSVGDGYISKGASSGLNNSRARYNGTLTGTAAELFTAISTQANWETFANTDAAGESTAPAIDLAGSFTVTGGGAVPEPSSFALLGLLCCAGLYQRRRKASRQ